MKIKQLITATILTIISAQTLALRETNVEAFLDPAFSDYQPSKILLVTNGSADFTRQIQKKVAKRIAKKYGVTVLEYKDIFVPTRTWSPEQVAEVLKDMEVGSILEITSDGYASDFQTVHTGTTGYVSHGTYSTSNNFTTYAADKSQVSAKLTDRVSENTVWVATISTQGSGTLMVGAGWTASSVVSNLVKDWLKNGLLRK